MRTRQLFTVLLISSEALFAGTHPNPVASPTILENTGRIAFTENKGQFHDQNYKPRTDIFAGAALGPLAFHLTKTGVSYQLFRVDRWEDVQVGHAETKIRTPVQQTIYRVDMEWMDAHDDFILEKSQALPGRSSYYLGACPEGVLNVKSYRGITLQNLYEGINLHYYEFNGQLKHDYIVKPGTDYRQIRLKVKGAAIAIKADGAILLTTPLGTIEEGRPLVLQSGRELKSRWKLEGTILSFEIEGVDPDAELIIDPLTRAWGTFCGGASNETATGCAIDATGNIYISGFTSSNTTTLIATTGAHQQIFAGGGGDAFLMKYNPAGLMLWGTYCGGSAHDAANSCAVDSFGGVYICGDTKSVVGIATASAHQTSFVGAMYDAFLVKFDSSGVRQWGTYYGSYGAETGNSCKTDLSGNIYLAGITALSTGTVIATPGSHQPNHVVNSNNTAFLVKFNSSGIRLWGTYYGESGNYGHGCATDLSGNVYLAGYSTVNSSGIATPGSHQPVHGGNGNNAFVAKFDSSGVRQWGTYYGGGNSTKAFACATDLSGNIYFTGECAYGTGAGSVATTGAHQQIFGGKRDALLVKLNGAGVRQWGTYCGGDELEFGFGCATDIDGNAYIVGSVEPCNSNVIATPGSHQVNHSQFSFSADGFLIKFDSAGVRKAGTFYGGQGFDAANACAIDPKGSVYIAGTSGSNDGVIATPNTQQPVHGGSSDGVLAKFNDCSGIKPIVGPTSALCENTTIHFGVIPSGTHAPSSYTWTGPNSFSSNLQSPAITSASSIHIGVYSVTLMVGQCVETATTQIPKLHSVPIITAEAGTTICHGATVALIAGGGVTYYWHNNHANTPVIVVNPSVTTSYTVTGFNANGCESSVVISQVVTPCTEIKETLAGEAFRVFPNPHNNVLTIEVERAASYILNDVLGRPIMQGLLARGVNELNTVGISSGYYFLTISRDDRARTVKVLKD